MANHPNKLSMYQRLAKSKRQKKFASLLADLLLGGFLLDQANFNEDQFGLFGRLEEPGVRRFGNMSVHGLAKELADKHSVTIEVTPIEGVASSYWVSVIDG